MAGDLDSAEVLEVEDVAAAASSVELKQRDRTNKNKIHTNPWTTSRSFCLTLHPQRKGNKSSAIHPPECS